MPRATMIVYVIVAATKPLAQGPPKLVTLAKANTSPKEKEKNEGRRNLAKHGSRSG